MARASSMLPVHLPARLPPIITANGNVLTCPGGHQGTGWDTCKSGLFG